MWCWSRAVAALVFGAMLYAAAAQAGFWQQTVSRADWQRHVTEGRLLELDAIRELLLRFEEREDVRVTIRYPGGDAGTAWAVQFRNRLVAYGVPSRYMELLPGSGGLDILHVSMVDGD